ncbi:RNA-directed DNA polymerase, eukaryota [Tanacetum coccineum]
MWDYLIHVCNQWKGEVLILGDFNEVRFKSDRFGTNFNVRGAVHFNSFIRDACLVEIPLDGCAYTWCHKSASKMSKLDRFFVSENLFRSCPAMSAITLDRFLSDHRPILLREFSSDYGPIPFRFFHYWMELDGFNDFVEDTWKAAPCVKANGMRNFMLKLKYLKGKIKEWIHEFKVRSKGEFNQLKDELQAVDRLLDKGNGSDELLAKRLDIMKSLQHINKIKASETAQKTKIKWSIEGDENSKFFHGSLNKNRSQSNIRGIMVDGEWVDKPSMVKSEFFQHFQQRFAEPAYTRATIDMNFPNVLSDSQKDMLEGDVSKEELKRAVWGCGTDKSPGPDGFTFGFIRKYWSVIENDVYEAVTHFFNKGSIPAGGNSSFIALIPKNHGANLVKDFRPITLIGCVYKMITKILTKPSCGSLLEACYEVDFEKAYDSVRWDYLDEVLHKFGFGTRWRTWILSCLRSARGSILINGSPTEEFQFYKGLKQGDPLSPFLFILVMESLHLSFQRVVDGGLFTGLNLNSSVTISHMFYADDAASGLRLNLCKSQILGLNVASDLVTHAATKLGCLILKTPFVYLGTKVGGRMSRINEWDDVVGKVAARMSKWKMKLLSIGGRFTLIKSVLGSIPIFHMSIYKVPMQVLRRLESIRNQFSMGHDPGLMIKWLWRFYSQKTALWVRVVKAIHGPDGKVGSMVSSTSNSCWLNIIKEINTLLDKGVDVLSYITHKLGNGDSIAFWEDKWFNNTVLKEAYPRLYSLERCKNVSVRSKLENGSLDDTFRRQVRGGAEESQLKDLVDAMREVILVPMADRFRWSLASNGEFSVSSIRKVLDDNFLPQGVSSSRWVYIVPDRLIFCVEAKDERPPGAV